ncbi:hypothetical protein DK389_23355 [Methylobacterium durans]|uniref:Uncharacterized protein n=2 Tax=Methylobacterium durans TaxID=2202825 RepID=A0A2U8WF03_9HYPH|nr:hypothetical protein DK389_23355 [Methylobacterium durans]
MRAIDRLSASEAELASATAAPHPEEMRATVDLTIGQSIAFRATARATPAGLVSAALLVAATLVPLVWLARTRRD